MENGEMVKQEKCKKNGKLSTTLDHTVTRGSVGIGATRSSILSAQAQAQLVTDTVWC